jgi:hypothetical protein
LCSRLRCESTRNSNHLQMLVFCRCEREKALVISFF